MKKHRIGVILGILAALLLSSCSQELSVTSTKGEGTPVQFSFGVSPLNATAGSSVITTRSTDYSTVDESAVSNIRTLQFSSDGNTLLSNVYAISPSLTNFTVMLQSATNSHVYFVANAGNNDSSDPLSTFNGTEATFKTLVKALTQESDLLYKTSANRINLPMCSAQQVITVAPYTILDKRLTPVALVRNVACLVVNYGVTIPGFVLRRVRVCNIPTTMEYAAPSATAGASATYPASLTAATVFNTSYTDVGDANTNNVSGATQSGTLYYYVSENQRGQTSTTTEKTKTGISGDYPTYVELAGYTPNSSDGRGELYFRVYPGGNMTNDYNLVRNTQYAVNATIKGLSMTEQRLGERALSNCYIVAPGQTIYIPVKRANQSMDMGTQIPDVTSTTLTSSVIWQTASGLITAVMDSKAGCIKVTASPSASTSGGVLVNSTLGGNALLAVKSGATTLWSWHIWVTNYDPLATAQNYNNGVVSNLFMDRNLGALNNNNNDINAFGLQYQWGRKDPFPQASAVGDGITTTEIPLYAENGTQLATNYIPANVTSTQASGMIQAGIQHPSSFYSSTVANACDWYSSSAGTHNNSLWGPVKTVYDPCPAGWRVPSIINGSSPWDNMTIASSGSGYILSGSGYSSLYAKTGYRKYTGELYLGSEGDFWLTSVASDAMSVLSLEINSAMSDPRINPRFSRARGYGCSVRCVKE